MTADQRFKRWVHRALAIFAVCFVYFLCADLWMPLTPQARVMHPVISVAPQVSGRVEEVRVYNNQHVEAGEVLFRIDSRRYELSVSKAELSLVSSGQDNEQLDASVAAARATVAASQATAHELGIEMIRAETLIKQHSISRQKYDQTRAERDSAKAQLAVDKAKVNALLVQRGLSGDDNLRLRQAQNALEQARLDLSYTVVRAKESGWVTNLQLSPGSYATAGQPLVALVADRADVVADFREKSLSLTQAGQPASIVFDARPGEVHEALLLSADAGVFDGQQSPDGNLAAPVATDRWVRDAQRMRVHLALNEDEHALLNTLSTGARATVQLYPVSGLAAWLGHAQVHLASLVHYIY